MQHDPVHAGRTGPCRRACRDTGPIDSDCPRHERVKQGQAFSRAYIDMDGDPCIEADVDLDSGGMPRALFLDNLDTWRSLVGALKAKALWH